MNALAETTGAETPALADVVAASIAEAPAVADAVVSLAAATSDVIAVTDVIAVHASTDVFAVTEHAVAENETLREAIERRRSSLGFRSEIRRLDDALLQTRDLSKRRQARSALQRRRIARLARRRAKHEVAAA